MGDSPFSEPETKSLSEYMATLGTRIVFYLDLHSYSQFILLPYGVDEPLPELDSWVSLRYIASSKEGQ